MKYRIPCKTISREEKNAETTPLAKAIVWSILFALTAALLVVVILEIKG